MRSTPARTDAPEVVTQDDFPSSGRADDTLHVRILGCSGGIGRDLRTSSVLLNREVLIDMGTGAGELTHAEMHQVDTLFLTHAHLDHTALLPMFLDTTFEHRVHHPLTVYALPETIDALRTHIFNDVIWPDFEQLPNIAHPVVQFVTIDPGEAVQVHGMTVHAVEAVHAVPSLGFCVESDGRVMAFSGDTMSNNTLWPRLNRFAHVETLIVEVSFPNAQEALARQAGHYTPESLAADLKKLRHSPDIWVTAMKPGYQGQILDELAAAIPNRDVRPLKRDDEFRL